MKRWNEEDFLKIDKWYHATSKIAFESILEHKILASFNKDNELDFGYGFYLTPSLEWVKKYAKSFDEERILEFRFTIADIISKDTKFKFFGSLNDEFADFVFLNRTRYSEFESFKAHDFDIVGGVMSDGTQATDFEEYNNHMITKEELYRRLCIPKEDWQIAISSQDLCNKIKPFSAFDLKGEVYDVSKY